MIDWGLVIVLFGWIITILSVVATTWIYHWNADRNKDIIELQKRTPAAALFDN